MKKLNLKTVGNFVGELCEVASYGVLFAVSCIMMDRMTDDCSLIGSYDKAVEAIMKSGMYSHDKREAVSVLKRDGDAEFYKAIIHIAKNSGMYSHDKVEMIKNLCE